MGQRLAQVFPLEITFACQHLVQIIFGHAAVAHLLLEVDSMTGAESLHGLQHVLTLGAGIARAVVDQAVQPIGVALLRRVHDEFAAVLLRSDAPTHLDELPQLAERTISNVDFDTHVLEPVSCASQRGKAVSGGGAWLRGNVA